MKSKPPLFDRLLAADEMAMLLANPVRRFLKPDEAGAILGVSPKTLANWRASNTGPSWSPNRGDPLRPPEVGGMGGTSGEAAKACRYATEMGSWNGGSR